MNVILKYFLIRFLLSISLINAFKTTSDVQTLTSPLDKHKIKLIKPCINEIAHKENLKDLLTKYTYKGFDVLMHGPPGLGKTHSMLTYGYDSISGTKNIKSNVPFRALYLSHSRELSIQSAELISTLFNKDCYSLLIGRACKIDIISLKKRFILSTSNSLSEYLLLMDPEERKKFLASVKLLLVDEIDAMLKLPNKYSSRRIALWNIKKNSFYNIFQAILAINGNKTQIISASATIDRRLSRTIDSLIHTFKKNHEGKNLIYIKVVDEEGTTKPVLENIKVYYKALPSFEEEIRFVSQLAKEDTIVFANHAYSIIRIKEGLMGHAVEADLLHESMGIDDDRKLPMNKILEKYKENKFQNNGLKIASMDSARGIVTMSKNIILMGQPRNVRELIHLLGRVVHNKTGGTCTVVGKPEDIKQTRIFCTLKAIPIEEHPRVGQDT